MLAKVLQSDPDPAVIFLKKMALVLLGVMAVMLAIAAFQVLN